MTFPFSRFWKHGLSTKKNSVSAYIGISKYLKDLKDLPQSSVQEGLM